MAEIRGYCTCCWLCVAGCVCCEPRYESLEKFSTACVATRGEFHKLISFFEANVGAPKYTESATIYMMTCFSTAIVLLIALISRASSSCSPITTTQADEGSELCYCADVEKPMDCAELPGPNRGDPGIPSGRLIRLDDNSIHCVPIDQHTACNGSPPNPTCGSAADGCNVVVLHDQSPICAAPGFGGPGTAVQDCMIDSPFCCKVRVLLYLSKIGVTFHFAIARF